MSGQEIAVLVVSCDRYSDLWAPFFKCFFKYWSDCPFQVYLGTNHKVLEDRRITTIAIGDDRSYSENLRAMLQQVREQWVIFWVDDRFISGPVDTARVMNLVRRAQEAGAASLKLIPEHPFGYPASISGINSVPKGTFYRVSLTVTLWQAVCLNTLLPPGESAWQLEKKGMHRSNALVEPFYALTRSNQRHPPIPHAHILIKGRLIRASLRFLKEEDLLGAFHSRELQTFTSQVYTVLFHGILRVVAPIRDKILKRKRHL